MATEWNSSEIAKLATSCATPIVVGCLGVYIHRITKRFEQFQWRNQKLIEKRLAIYDELAPQLNDILCYFTYVGRWKDCSPPSIIEMKRNVDRNIYLAQPLFSQDFFNACMDFISCCYQTYTGWGNDAKLRSTFERRRSAHPRWNPAWETCFSDNPSEPQDVRRAYQHVISVFAVEIGLDNAPPHIRAGRVPANVS